MRRKAIVRPDRDREIFRVLRAIKGKKSSEVAKGTYVAASTIQAWRTGKTKYPQHHTLAAVARTAGLKYELVEIEDSDRASDSRTAGERAGRSFG
jgi:transcriptional regulator with XRE-family HTH domain